jgi:hypothetical protein
LGNDKGIEERIGKRKENRGKEQEREKAAEERIGKRQFRAKEDRGR